MPQAVGSTFGAINNFASAPNLPMQNYNDFSGTFDSMKAPSGYNPADTVNAGNFLTNQSMQLSPWIQQMLGEGFDPQGDVYGRAAHNLQDQTRVGLSSRGLDMTPYGAGVEGSTMGNFNLDWENNKLGRMNTALGGAGQGLGAMGQGITQGQQLAGSAPGWQAQIMQALSNAGIATDAHTQALINSWLQYTQQGQKSANDRFAGQSANYQQQQADDAAMWQGIGQVAGSAASVAMM